MLAYIFLNGEPCNSVDVPKDALVIAADGGLNFCLQNDIPVDVCVGDFDSLGHVTEGAIVYPVEKDFTDAEIALNIAKEKGATEVIFACAGGYRDDHHLANIYLLEYALTLGINAMCLTKYSKIYIVSDKIDLDLTDGTCVSVIPIDNSVIKSSVGLKYPYCNTVLNRYRTLGISNVALGRVKIELTSGKVLVFVNL